MNGYILFSSKTGALIHYRAYVPNFGLPAPDKFSDESIASMSLSGLFFALQLQSSCIRHGDEPQSSLPFSSPSFPQLQSDDKPRLEDQIEDGDGVLGLDSPLCSSKAFPAPLSTIHTSPTTLTCFYQPPDVDIIFTTFVDPLLTPPLASELCIRLCNAFLSHYKSVIERPFTASQKFSRFTAASASVYKSLALSLMRRVMDKLEPIFQTQWVFCCFSDDLARAADYRKPSSASSSVQSRHGIIIEQPRSIPSTLPLPSEGFASSSSSSMMSLIPGHSSAASSSSSSSSSPEKQEAASGKIEIILKPEPMPAIPFQIDHAVSGGGRGKKKTVSRKKLKGAGREKKRSFWSFLRGSSSSSGSGDGNEDGYREYLDVIQQTSLLYRRSPLSASTSSGLNLTDESSVDALLDCIVQAGNVFSALRNVTRDAMTSLELVVVCETSFAGEAASGDQQSQQQQQFIKLLVLREDEFFLVVPVSYKGAAGVGRRDGKRARSCPSYIRHLLAEEWTRLIMFLEFIHVSGINVTPFDFASASPT